MQNRIEHTLNNLANYEENLTSANSRIQDVDMASEMVNFTKLQVLQQAGTAMLAQANQAPRASSSSCASSDKTRAWKRGPDLLGPAPVAPRPPKPRPHQGPDLPPRGDRAPNTLRGRVR